jgi:hypothetical protein
MWPIRIIALLGCAEWLLIFRTWVSFRYLFLYGGFAALRLFYFLNFFPHWNNNYILLPICLLAVLYHLRSAWRSRTSHNQQTYGTPETGVPWLVIIAQNPKRALALEFAIITIFIFFLFNYGNIVYPRGFGALPQALQAWLSSPSNVKAFAGINAFWMLFAYSLWNLAVSRVPLWRPRTAPSSDAYQYVREANHNPPKLPSVKDLSDDLSNFYS